MIYGFDHQRSDSCGSLLCGRGRECQMNAAGHPECVCVRKCRKHHKLICGTDGILYSSHCELHRAACLASQPIAVDHTYLCLRRKGTYIYRLCLTQAPIAEQIISGISAYSLRSVSSWIDQRCRELTLFFISGANASLSSMTVGANTSRTTFASQQTSTSTTTPVTETRIIPDSFVKPAGAPLCSQQDYEILKAGPPYNFLRLCETIPMLAHGFPLSNLIWTNFEFRNEF